MKRTGTVPAVLAACTAAGLLWKTQEVAEGVRTGLSVCAGTVIPSLFPFMVLAGLIASTSAGERLSHTVSSVTKKLLGLPEALGAVLLMSFVGGFPVGAKMLAAMLEHRQIDSETASYSLCFCVNAGPSFVISAVGAAMLGSLSAGLILLGAQLLSALIICGFVSRRRLEPVPPVKGTPSSSAAFVEAVRGAASGMLGICAFITAFSALTALLNALGLVSAACGALGYLFPQLGSPFFSALITGLMEVTSGCKAAAALHTRAGFVLCAFLVSFSSLSISFQVQSCFPGGCGVRFMPYCLSRLIHGGMTALLAWFGWNLLPEKELAVMIFAGRPVPQAAPNMMISSACLICMCAILVLNLPKTAKYAKKPKYRPR